MNISPAEDLPNDQEEIQLLNYDLPTFLLANGDVGKIKVILRYHDRRVDMRFPFLSDIFGYR